MMHRSAYTIALICICWDLSSSIIRAQETGLLQILRTRSQVVQTFLAQVKFTKSAGSEQKELAKDTRLFADWLSTHRPELPWRENQEYATLLERKQLSQTAYFRYSALATGMIRIEQYGSAPDPDTAYARKPSLSIYTEEKWYEYTPAQGKGPSWGSLWIPEKGAPMIPQFEVARTEGLMVNPYIQASNKALGIRQMAWDEFLSKTPTGSARSLVEPLPTGGNALSMLEMTTGPPVGKKANWVQPETSLGAYRVRLWLDSKRGYVPVRMEAQHLIYNFQTKKFYYLPDEVAEWSDPVQLANGITFCQKCILHIFEHFMPIVESEADGNHWPQKAYESMIEQFEFTNVRINEPVDPALFKFVPPPNTNVIDEVSGFHLATGSTGELIKKEALSYQSAFPAPTTTSWPTWKKALLGALILAVGVFGVLVLKRLMRPTMGRKIQ